MGLFGKPTIRREIRRHGITFLLHSTHLYKNLPSLLEDGTLHTVRTLRERHGIEKAARYLHDPRRYEQFAVGLDYLNASLSYPNTQLLYGRSKSDWKAEWVHLALDLELLDHPDTLFCPVSAAAEFGKYVAGGLEGFRAMFAEEVHGQKREGLPKNVPTHPQAEVLLRGPLAIASVQAILVPTAEVAREVERLCSRHALLIRIETTPQLFVWPKWLVGK